MRACRSPLPSRPSPAVPALFCLVLAHQESRPRARQPFPALSSAPPPPVPQGVADAHGRALDFTRSRLPGCKDPAGGCGGGAAGGRHLGLYGFRARFLAAYVALPDGPLQLAEDLEQLKAPRARTRTRAEPAHSACSRSWQLKP